MDIGFLLLHVGGWFLLFTPAFLALLALSTMPVAAQRGLAWFLRVLSLVMLLLLCAWYVQRTRHGWADFIAGEEPTTWTWMTSGGWVKTLPTCSGLMTYTAFLLLAVLVVSVDMLALRWVHRLSKSVLLTILLVHIVLFVSMFVVAFHRWSERVGGTLPGDPHEWAKGNEYPYVEAAAHDPGVVYFNARVVERKRTVTFLLEFSRYGSGHVILGLHDNEMSLNKILPLARRFRQTAAIWTALFAPGDQQHDIVLTQAIQENAAGVAFSIAFLDWLTQQWCILVVGQLSARYPVVVGEHGTTIAVIDCTSEQHGFVKRVLPVARLTHMFTSGLQVRHPVPPEFARSTNKDLIPLLQALRDPWDKAIDASMETVLPLLDPWCTIVLSRRPEEEVFPAAA